LELGYFRLDGADSIAYHIENYFGEEWVEKRIVSGISFMMRIS
jgi:hypothetical protein